MPDRILEIGEEAIPKEASPQERESPAEKREANVDAEVLQQYDLRRVSDQEWVIYNLRFAMDDARCVVACVWESDDDEVQVVWLDGRAMPTRYLSVGAVLDDLAFSLQRGAGGTRPIEIAHLPPLRLVG